MKMARKLVAFFLVILLVIGILDNNVVHAENNNSFQKEEATSDSGEAFADADYQVKWMLGGSWATGHNMTVTIANMGMETITNWQLSFDYAHPITQIWNAELIECKEGKVTVKNAGWNKDIPVGGEITFGFACEEPFSVYPEGYMVCCRQITEVNGDIEVIVENNWGNGCKGAIIIRNNTDQIMEDWQLEFDCNGRLESVWDGQIVSNNEGRYTVKNAGYNYVIEPNSDRKIGFVLSAENGENAFSNFLLRASGNNGINDSNNPSEQESDDFNDDPDDFVEANLGEAYVKDSELSDIVIDGETGMAYVKNQILISAFPGAEKANIEEMAAEMNADIVGFIEFTNDYQLEFRDDKTLDEINALIERVFDNPFISNCTLNSCIVSKYDSEISWEDALFIDNIKAWKSDITKYNENTTIIDEGKLSIKTGDNWGLKALNIPAAWQITNHENSVRVGIYDHGFAFRHEDLSFVKQYNNIELSDDRSHGTHVAGIIGAKHNKIGIAGVATNAQLITYSNDGEWYNEMEQKLALATLIGNHVRVINYSRAWSNVLAYVASNPNDINNKIALDDISYYKSNMEEYLLKFYTMGYDFSIVTSAGNTNGKVFVKDDSMVFGYKVVDATERMGKREVDVMADYNSVLNAITNPILKNRIIVVGAVRQDIKENGTQVIYNIFKSSNLGARVDVVAPGHEILSTVPYAYTKTEIKGYALDSGTSMAAPYVTGILALMYQTNPNLNAEDAKRIVCDHGNCVESISYKGMVYYMPDAEKCVKAALELKDGQEQEVPKKNGLLLGKIITSEGGAPGVTEIELTNANDVLNPLSGNKNIYRFTSTEDGTFICSVPEDVYRVTIHKEGYYSHVDWNVNIVCEETTNLGEITLFARPNLIRLFGEISYSKERIPDVILRFRKGLNNRTGEYVQDEKGIPFEVHTDSAGYYEIDLAEDEYTIEVIKDGYANEYQNLRLSATEIEQKSAERNIGFTFKNEDTYKIVLSWENSAVDLDLDVSCISGSDTVCRISAKRNTNSLIYLKTRIEGDEEAELGTETMLISGLDKILLGNQIILAVSVYDNQCPYGSFCGHFYAANAKLCLYKNEELIQVFEAPSSADRKVWHAFNLREGDVVETVNRATDLTP
ncbi:MAG: cellulose binding domain-containing protein [Lachnospiraceae bacterium]|nr:cellulose binding domain-containing protein [Lachnospiraceae bacterium]